MSKQNSFSFLSRFDPNELFDLKDLPSSLGLSTSFEQSIIQNDINIPSNNDNNNNNIEISSTHILVPQSSISIALEKHLAEEFDHNTFVGIEFGNLLNETCNNFDVNSLNLTSNIKAGLPNNEPFAGVYGFKAKMNSAAEKNLKKNIPWTFSKLINKLYCSPGVACPIEFKVDAIPPLETIIKAECVYSKPEHINQTPKRCENHKISRQFENNENLPDEALYHLVRCQHLYATYINQIDNYSIQRHSVSIPYEKPSIGAEWTTAFYKFMCFSSCIGGNNKPIKILLTLENNGEILGRDSFEVKICACPGRDRSTDEKKFEKQKSKINLDSVKCSKSIPKPTPTPTAAMTVQPVFNNQIRVKSISNLEQKSDNEIFTLQVKGRKNYEILKKLNDALEFESNYMSDKNKTSSFTLIKEPEARTEKRKESSVSITSLEQYLEKIDMSAYYNIIISKGIKNLEDLLNSNKKKIDNLKISERDTKKLWMSIQETKQNRQAINESKKHKNQIEKLNHEQSNNLVEISKYQIIYK